MEQAAFRDAILASSTALAAAARRSGPDASVPSCPGWSAAKLVKHTGTAQRWATQIVELRATEPVDPRGRDLGLPDDVEAFPDWLEAGARALVDQLQQVDPDAPMWTWGPDQHARFWARRMAHETAVHRWDGQRAAGDPEPVDGDLAVDGIDEFLENLSAALVFRSKSLTGNGETIHLHATDRDGEWLLRLDPEGIAVSREHAKGDVAVRASASDLLLLLMGRVAPADLETFGDAGILSEWQETATM